ncbi:hypothetical protein [Actinoplanes sp. M2I2]|uniref:hypothetical protein n=1 Tax=Actinoplanes sp. M2I2 TaxID=1734444 RepID=UPI00201FCE64|nr:hypothetical protein [Actinoplanes sp. M2I2]
MLDSPEAYLSTFLTASDLHGLRVVQDSRLGADVTDSADDFARHRGIHAGMRVWTGDDTVIERLVDIRWLFEDPQGAAAFHREQIRINSEGVPLVSGAPAVGKACMVFGGALPTPIMPDMTMTAYHYVFLAGPVLVKLFAAQSFDLPPSTLTPSALVPLALCAQQLINIAFP